MKSKILFTPDSIPFILEAFGLTVGDYGYVVYLDNKEQVLDVEGKPFKSEDLCGIIGDSFITNPYQVLGLKIKN